MMTESALVVSVLSVPAALGSTFHTECVWVVPEDLGTPSMRVVPGTELPISVDVTSVDSGLLVSVDTSVELVGECVRCLDPVNVRHEVRASGMYFDSPPESEEGEDEDVLLIGPHDSIDLEPLLRDSIIPLVDDRPLCRPECRGLCQDCGRKLDELPSDHHHEVIDPRLASLAVLLPDSDTEAQ